MGMPQLEIKLIKLAFHHTVHFKKAKTIMYLAMCSVQDTMSVFC